MRCIRKWGDPRAGLCTLVRYFALDSHADKITKPVMVLQGAQDPRVLKVESDEIVAAVQRKTMCRWSMSVFEDEGHGFCQEGQPD